LIRQQAGGEYISPKRNPLYERGFFDYRPRVISKIIFALQKERDKTIFIKMKVKLVASNTSPPSTKSGERRYSMKK
jgi:hypothetical protein